MIEAFYVGYAMLREQVWDFVVKLDGDLSFGRDYFASCLTRFEAEATLGIGGGTIRRLEAGGLEIDSPGDPAFHVRGATKIYRRACWNDIGPLIRAPGWDTVDEVKANARGWSTRTFADLTLIQLKPTGAAYGQWRNWFKNGRANYIAGYHPAFMIGKCVKRAIQRPVVVGSLGLLAGYVSGYISREPQMNDKDAMCYLRRHQVRFLLGLPSIYDSK